MWVVGFRIETLGEISSSHPGRDTHVFFFFYRGFQELVSDRVEGVRILE